MEATQSRDLSVSFLKKEQVASDTWTFYFDKTKDPFSHLPGQYIRMILPQDNPDDRGTSRFFTISSSPLEQSYFTITTKIGQSTFKKALANLVPGVAITCFGPLGNFVLQDYETLPLVFLAGGIGITPFHSMLTYAAVKKLAFPMTLFVSFSNPSEMVFYEELMKVTNEQQNIRVIFTITHPETSQIPWQGEIGRISEALIKKYITDAAHAKYYVVGPQAMVEATKEMLLRMGIPAEQILVENFPGY